MCGILGVYKKYGIDRELFNNQLNAIYHRGPDDHGVFFSEENNIGLGSRRLAIQDLTENGHMPMQTSDGNYTIVFNGEIYNANELRVELISLGENFISNSDTECILYAYKHWGKNCLHKLNGMFSISIYDRLNNIFFIARDRSGEKPLYYWIYGKGFSFSSELKQLLIDNELPRNLNKKAVKQYLEDGYVKGNQSFITDVFKLPAAHFLIYNINDQSLKLDRYWDVPKYENSGKTKEELKVKLDQLLTNSVKRQMISDVPLGVLLSGGVDSSLITSYAVENTNQLKTFHISFNGFGKFDESGYAKKVANYFNTDHHELSGNEIEFNMIDEILDYYDEPLGDSSMLPTYLVSKLTKQHVTVALGGDGGDELFGGYTSYSNIFDNKKIFLNAPEVLKKSLSKLSSNLPIGFRGRNFLINSVGNTYERFLHNRLFDEYSIENVISKEYFSEILNIKSKPDIEVSSDRLYDLTKYDFNNYLVDDILVKVDRASMASSLELRAPFLDKHIVEFAFSELPSSLKVNDGRLKILLKELLLTRMPKANFNTDRKQGFSLPLNDWIANKWQDKFIEEINEFSHIFDKKVILQMCLNVKKGYSNSSKLYALIILNKWLKKYKINY
jgi:asparagine synthase (glutamine-hydrolysing)